MNFQNQILENSNNPQVQQQIANAAENGARDAGFKIAVNASTGRTTFLDQNSYDNQEDVFRAAQDRVNETEVAA